MKAMSLGRTWFATLVAATAIMMSMRTVALAAKISDEVNPKMRRELEMAEERFGQAIEKRDTGALTDMLADYFSAAVGNEEKAASKARVIAQAKAGTLIFYRMERDVRLRVSAEYYDLNGEAKAPPRGISDKPVQTEWVKVRRMWIKKEGRWLLILQHVSEPEDEKESEQKEK
jgi:hypothetical protein